MALEKKTLWICDEADSRQLFGDVFGFQFTLRFFDNELEFQKAVAELNSPKFEGERPFLVIVDLELANLKTKGALESLRDYALIALGRDDDVELLRTYFRAGAVDFIRKPFRAGELIARSERVIERLLLVPFELLPATIEEGLRLNLTFKERQLLAIFLLSEGRAVTRSQLFGSVWNQVSVNKKTLDVHLFNLRRKLHPTGYDIICHEQIYTLSRKRIESP